MTAPSGRVADIPQAMMSQLPPIGIILYKYVLVVIPQVADGRKMHICAETSVDGMNRGTPPFLCVYGATFGQGHGHSNQGYNEDWNDLEKFAAKARQIVCEELKESEGRSPSKRWWQFWKR